MSNSDKLALPVCSVSAEAWCGVLTLRAGNARHSNKVSVAVTDLPSEWLSRHFKSMPQSESDSELDSDDGTSNGLGLKRLARALQWARHLHQQGAFAAADAAQRSLYLMLDAAAARSLIIVPVALAHALRVASATAKATVETLAPALHVSAAAPHSVNAATVSMSALSYTSVMSIL